MTDMWLSSDFKGALGLSDGDGFHTIYFDDTVLPSDILFGKAESGQFMIARKGQGTLANVVLDQSFNIVSTTELERALVLHGVHANGNMIRVMQSTTKPVFPHLSIGIGFDQNSNTLYYSFLGECPDEMLPLSDSMYAKIASSTMSKKQKTHISDVKFGSIGILKARAANEAAQAWIDKHGIPTYAKMKLVPQRARGSTGMQRKYFTRKSVNDKFKNCSSANECILHVQSMTGQNFWHDMEHDSDSYGLIFTADNCKDGDIEKDSKHIVVSAS